MTRANSIMGDFFFFFEIQPAGQKQIHRKLAISEHQDCVFYYLSFLASPQRRWRALHSQIIHRINVSVAQLSYVLQEPSYGPESNRSRLAAQAVGHAHHPGEGRAAAPCPVRGDRLGFCHRLCEPRLRDLPASTEHNFRNVWKKAARFSGL